MRKQVFGRQFNRDTNARKALFKGLVNDLIMHERIQTTEERAKAIKPYAERLVTKAKKGGQNAQVLLRPHLSKDAMQKMVDEIAPRFTDRPGGYTRIFRVGSRLSDQATMAYIEWVVRPMPIMPVVKADSDEEDQEVDQMQQTATTAKAKRPAKTKATPTKKEVTAKSDKKPAKKTKEKTK